MNQEPLGLGYYNYEGATHVVRMSSLSKGFNHSSFPRIKVVASSINPVDYKILLGEQKFLMTRSFPKIFGTDFFGYYESSPDSIPQPVIGMTNPLTYGSCRSYIDPKKATFVPVHTNKPEACSIPAAGLTALYTLSKSDLATFYPKGKQSELDKRFHPTKKKVFIIGSNGGVGFYAVQLYKLLGYQISVSCSNQWHSRMIHMGVSEVYERGEMPQGKEFDVIIDCPGILHHEQIMQLIRKKTTNKTTYVPVSIPNNRILQRIIDKLRAAPRYSLKIILTVPKKSYISTLVELYDQNHLILCPIRFFSLDQGEKAISSAKAGGFIGKIGLKISKESKLL